MKKAKLWAHGTYGMVEHGDFSRRLNLPAYVRAENYDFLMRRCENLEAEIAKLKAVTHDDDTCPNLVPANRQYHQALSANRKLLDENARLKAEVDELKSQPDPLTAYLYAAELAKQEMKCLKAEVERLTKAGDAMSTTLINGGVIVSGYILADDWLKAKLLSAKKGGQP